MFSVTRLILVPLLAINFLVQSGNAEPAPYINREDVQAFATDMAKQYGQTPSHWLELLKNAHYQAQVANLVAPPDATSKKNWQTYRQRFLDATRIREGVQFWQRHEAALQRAEKEYGIPPEIIVGILGVETLYGKKMGTFSVLDALSTLAFDYPDMPNKPARSALFREELAQYLVLCDSAQINPQQFKGSYAGAIGIPQFMPSSIRSYAISFDGKKSVDLYNNPNDAISSVGNFLKQHGWEIGRPILWTLAKDAYSNTVAEKYADGLPKPHWPLKQLLDAGLRLQEPLDLKKEEQTSVLIIDLPTPDQATQYRVGLQNFYILTRYNRSFFYALSVYELGQAILAAKTPSLPKSN